MGRKDKSPTNENNFISSLGVQMRQLRQKKNISLTDMAPLVKYSKSYLSGVETGSVSPSQELARKYEEVLSLIPGSLTAAFQTPSSQAMPLEERPCTIPYEQNSLFTGRNEILDLLHKKLNGMRKAPRIIALTGLSGMGKTQIAAEYGWRYRTEYRGIFWLKADSAELLISEFTNIIQQIPPDEKTQQLSATENVKRWFRLNPTCLIVVDSLDNPEDLNPMVKLLSQLGETRIIMTTRIQAVGAAIQTLPLAKMSIEESALFLLRRIHILSCDTSFDEATEIDQSDASEIAKVMDGLPLALDQAGSYIEETGCKLQHYLTLFGIQRMRLLRERGKFSIDHPEAIATTWPLSFQEVQKTNQKAADLLYLCAFLHPDAIYRDIILEGGSSLGPLLRACSSDPMELDNAIAELLRYSLVQSSPKTGFLTIHRLVQSVIRDTMDHQTQQMWAERTVRAINDVFPGIDSAEWITTREKCREYFAHAQGCITLIEQWKMKFVEAIHLMRKLGSYLEELSEFDRAQKLYLQVLDLDKERENVEPDHLIADYKAVAELYYKKVEYKEADRYYKEALKIKQETNENVQLSPIMIETINSYRLFLRNIDREAEARELKVDMPKNIQQKEKHITINDDSLDITYHGKWEEKQNPSGVETGDYGGNIHYTDTEEASFEYTFIGIGIAIISDTNTTQGIIDIYMDGRYLERKNLSLEPQKLPQTVVYHTKKKLDYGEHTIRGVLISGNFALDALVKFTYDEE